MTKPPAPTRSAIATADRISATRPFPRPSARARTCDGASKRVPIREREITEHLHPRRLELGPRHVAEALDAAEEEHLLRPQRIAREYGFEVAEVVAARRSQPDLPMHGAAAVSIAVLEFDVDAERLSLPAPDVERRQLLDDAVLGAAGRAGIHGEDPITERDPTEFDEEVVAVRERELRSDRRRDL